MLCDTMSQNNKRSITSKTKKKKKTIFLSDVMDDLWDCNFVEIVEELNATTDNNVLLEQIIFEEGCHEESPDIWSTLKLSRNDSEENSAENLHSSGEVDTSEQKIGNQVVVKKEETEENSSGEINTSDKQNQVFVKKENDFGDGGTNYINTGLIEESNTNNIETGISCSYKPKQKHINNLNLNLEKKNKIMPKEEPQYVVYNDNKNDEVFNENTFEEKYNIDIIKPAELKSITFDQNNLDDFKNSNCINVIEEESDADSNDENDNVDSLKESLDFKCDKCDFETYRKTDFKRHINFAHSCDERLSKSKKKIIKCGQCDFQTVHPHSLRRHLKRLHDPKNRQGKSKMIYKCDKCGYKSSHKKNLSRHHKSMHTGDGALKINIIECGKCAFQTLYPDCLKRHLSRFHDPATMTKKPSTIYCEKCAFRTFYPINLKRHIRRFHDAAKITQSLISESENPGENQTENDVKIYNCDKCQFQSVWQENLRRHVRRFHNAPKITENFISKSKNLTENDAETDDKIHNTSSSTSNSVKVLMCKQCNFKARNRGNLFRHVKGIHNDPKNPSKIYKCDKCPFQSVYPANLKRHIKRNCQNPAETTQSQISESEEQMDNDVKIDLEICSSKLHAGSENEKDNVNIFKTDNKHCNFETYNKTNLKCNSESDAGSDNEKDYCTSGSTSNSVKVLTCKKCNFKTRNRGNFFRHVKGIHSDLKNPSKIYKCDKCPFQSVYPANLKRHIKRSCKNPAKTTQSQISESEDETDKDVKVYFKICSTELHAGSENEKYNVSTFKTDNKHCNFKTHNKTNLNRQVDIEHISESKELFSKSKPRDSTKQDVKPKRVYKCDQCDFKTNFRKNHLNLHRKYVHADVSKMKIIKCDKCDYQTVFPVYLRRHHRTRHDPTNVKPKQVYKCDKCEFKTAYKKSLITHQQSMHVDLLKCSLCSYETTYWRRFTAHINNHKQNQNAPSELFKCEICTYQTINKIFFRTHQKRVHSGGTVLACKNCEYKTTYIASLRRHLKARHKDSDC